MSRFVRRALGTVLPLALLYFHVALAAGEEPVPNANPKVRVNTDLVDSRAGKSALVLAEIQALNDAERFAEAEKLARETIAAHKTNAQLYNLHGFALRKLKKWDASIAAYKEALKINPDFPQAKEYLAVAYLNLRKVSEAKKLHAELKGEFPDLALMIENEAKRLKVKW